MGPDSASPSSDRRSTREVAGSHSTRAQPQGVASDSVHVASAPVGSDSADLNTTSPSTSSFTAIGMSAFVVAGEPPTSSTSRRRSRRAGEVAVVVAISAGCSCRVQNVSRDGMIDKVAVAMTVAGTGSSR